MTHIPQQLRDARLYLVLDASVAGYPELFDIMRAAVEHGVDIVQLRDKAGHARGILEFTRKAVAAVSGKALFILNDRLDLALAGGAHGVHLGQDDLPIEAARRLAGEGLIIGVSCQTLEHLQAAQDQGADYVGFGSVFKTQTKPDRVPMDLEILKKVAARSVIPVFAIGGITAGNIRLVLDCGIRRIAVTRAVCQAKDVASAVRQLTNAFPC